MSKQYKKSLKRKIQNALMKSSLLSIVITSLAMIALVGMISTPLGTFFTNSINNSIRENYMRMERQSYNTEAIEKNNFLSDLSYEELKKKDFSNKIINKDHSLEIMSDEDMVDLQKNIIDKLTQSIVVSGVEDSDILISESEKKALMISAIQTKESMDKFLSLGNSFGFDWVKSSLYLFDGDKDVLEFELPSGEIAFINKNPHKKIEDDMLIVDQNGDAIGYISTELNSSIVFILTFPIIVILILIALVTFIIVKILLGPSTYKLVKPIKKLNNQLKLISENEVIDSTVHIEMNKPPKEIFELVKYSNIIMARLNDSQELMFAQNQELEAQRDELEAQNAELDSQNIELYESQHKLKKAQDQLVQSEKLASMGQLTAAIAHEINTPLGAVSSNSQMLEMMLKKLKKLLSEEDYDASLKLVDKLSRSNNITLDAANRVTEIIRNLKNFSRIDQAEFQNADVNEGIKSVLVLTSNLWKNKIMLNEEYGDIPLINCYPSMLNQVFMNVIVNAVQASDKNGRINIKTEQVDDYIIVSITDEGMGIDSKLLENIFESGYTTKPKDEGTGLGLSISRDIINKHHGTITAHKNKNKGVTFEIKLPIKQIIHDESCEHE